MLQKPLFHAGAAILYIVGVALIVQTLPALSAFEDTLLAPILMLSLLVLSVAVMAYLFGVVPLTLYLDGKKKEGITFFLHTLVYFAGFIVLYLLGLFLFVR